MVQPPTSGGKCFFCVTHGHTACRQLLIHCSISVIARLLGPADQCTPGRVREPSLRLLASASFCNAHQTCSRVKMRNRKASVAAAAATDRPPSRISLDCLRSKDVHTVLALLAPPDTVGERARGLLRESRRQCGSFASVPGRGLVSSRAAHVQTA